MKKYNIHISSTTNIYATFTKDGESYWHNEIKLTFELGETVAKFKEEGDRQCKTNGFVNLFTVAAACAKDPFHEIKVIYRPGAWVDAQGNEFKFVLITKKGEIVPKKGKLIDILRELGMSI